MNEWTSEAGRKRLRALLDAPVGPDGPTVFGGGDMRELLDALEEAEVRRDDALADYARVLAEKRAVEVVAEHFGWDGQTALDVWVIVQARMAREERATIEWIETAARGLGYDGDGDGALPDWFARICRERDEARAALLHVETLGFHVENCYAHLEREPDDVEPRCVPECPTATAQRVLMSRAPL